MNLKPFWLPVSTGEIFKMCCFVLLVVVSLGEELFLRVLQKTNYGEPSTSTTPRFIRTLAKR